MIKDLGSGLFSHIVLPALRTAIKILLSLQVCIYFFQLCIDILDSFFEIVSIGFFVNQGLDFDILSFNVFFQFLQFCSLGPISDLCLDFFPDRRILMLYFKEFHMNLTLQGVSKVIVERICQYSVNELLDQFQQSVFLNLIDLSDLGFQL